MMIAFIITLKIFSYLVKVPHLLHDKMLTVFFLEKLTEKDEVYSFSSTFHFIRLKWIKTGIRLIPRMKTFSKKTRCNSFFILIVSNCSNFTENFFFNSMNFSWKNERCGIRSSITRYWIMVLWCVWTRGQL